MKQIRLDAVQKKALARLLSDLIEADFIVEKDEMAFFENVISKDAYNINKTLLAESKGMTFAEAVLTLKETDENTKAVLLSTLKDLSLSDGTCVPLEAIQIFSIEQALKFSSEIYSVPLREVNIDNMKVIYISTDDESEVSNCIAKDYDFIRNEFLASGFDFVFIPNVTREYRNMERDYLRRVINYMNPSIQKEETERICKELCNMTLSNFCSEILYKKIGLPFDEIEPSFLIKINESVILNDRRLTYANFLRIPIKTKNILEEIHSFLSRYNSMINESIIVEHKPQSQKFLYYGFHKTLFDLIAYGKKQKEYKLVFDISTRKAKIYFQSIDGEQEVIPLKLNAQQSALFFMIVKQSLLGCGLEWSEKEEEKRRLLLQEFNEIYKRIKPSGDKVWDYRDRGQVSKIRSEVRDNKCKNVINSYMFIPENIRNRQESYYKINAKEKYIKIIE